MKPVVSVITPTYNHEGFIADCIESVLRQIRRDWEMIVIDDGSTDGTAEIVRRYNDPRITLIHKEHRGIEYLGENYNHALEISEGKYILVLEGDDFIPPRRIEMQLPAFEDKEVVLSHGKYACVWNNRTLVYPTPFKEDLLNNQPLGSVFKLFLQGINPIGTQSVMVRRSALLEAGGFEQPPYLPLVDYPTWMKLALKGRFLFIPEVLGYWRRHPLSITMNKNEQIFKGFIKYCDEFVISFNEELSKLGLEEFVKNRGAIAYLSLAWMNLSNGEWEKALDFVKKSWGRKETISWSFKMKIVIAIISAYLHLDIPSYFKKMMRRLNQREVLE